MNASAILSLYSSEIAQKSNVEIKNINGRLPENSRNSFVDLQSKKTVKKTDQKIVFSLKADMLHFD